VDSAFGVGTDAAADAPDSLRPMTSGSSRRAFLRHGATGGLFGGLAALTGCEPGRTRHPRLPDAIDAQTVRAAERLAGVVYTDAERQQIVDVAEGQLELLQARRRFSPPQTLAPATTFDPRPVGFVPPRQPPSTRASVPARPAKPAGEVEIAHASIAQLGRWLRAKQISAVELTRLCLDRLGRLGPALSCVVTHTEALALEQARRADAELAAGRDRGPLHGIPWGAKDLFDTSGIETSWGATPYRGRIPQRDATVVRRLEQAGAVLVAKLSLGALAYGDQWYDGRTKNPWNPDEGSSGSSAGSSAAVAAGLVPFALGTETLGSIVSPSMRCGVTGLRPTFGRVSRTGAMALCWSLDKVGPLARHVEDCALVLAEINGHDRADPGSLDVHFAWDGTRGSDMDPARSLAGVRIGRVPSWFDDANEVELGALELARRRGAEIVDVELPNLPYDGLLTILQAEAAAAFEGLTLDGRDDQLAWQDLEAWPNTFRAARFIPAVDLVQADRLRRRTRDAMQDAFASSGADAMLGPSFADAMLVITNFTGHPSLTLRAGFIESPARDLHGRPAVDAAPHRVPHGITLWGRLFDEGRLCRIGRALEAALGVADERAPLG